MKRRADLNLIVESWHLLPRPERMTSHPGKFFVAFRRAILAASYAAFSMVFYLEGKGLERRFRTVRGKRPVINS
jgi:hypothetical protein